MKSRIRIGLVWLAVLTAAPGAVAAPVQAAAARSHWVWPANGPIVRRFIAPTTRYGPGHRGIDIQVADRSPVGATGAGRVLFAGLVAGNLHVTVQHATSGWVTGYSNLATVVVRPGQRVRAGEIIGRSGGHLARHQRSSLHFSLRIAGEYRDPEILLGTRRRAWVHLVPLDRVAPSAQPSAQPFGLWWRWPVH